MRKLKKLKILNAVINISRYVCICIALTEILSLLGLIEELSYDTNLVLCTVAGDMCNSNCNCISYSD